MLFDTHAHYDCGAFDLDRYEVLDVMNAAGVGLVIDPGCDLESSRAAVELAERYDFVYAAVGWHPEELDSLTDEGLREIRRLAERPKTVAVGEIGLDYYWGKERKEEQKALFSRQLDMAAELDLPVIIHDREAHGDSLEIVSEYKGLRGVFHCYSGSPEMAEELLKRGWYLGFDGPVTYKNAKKQLEVLEMCPVDRVLLETDSPYMTPVPHRGERNDSRMLRFIAEKAAEVKHMSYDEIVDITEENGRKLFKIGENA
jgi:TatD DNase family protein